jgi:hypothetical protein
MPKIGFFVKVKDGAYVLPSMQRNVTINRNGGAL